MQTQSQENQIKDLEVMRAVFAEEPINVCKTCGNVYKNLWMKTGEQFNDFGFRYCPFCGAETEDFAHIC